MTLQLVRAVTTHARPRGDVPYAFRARLDMVLLDMEADLPRRALFSRNRFNLAAVNDRDYGGKGAPLRGAAWLREMLAGRGLTESETGILAACRVLLLTQPRLLGSLFNPVSFWFLVDGGGDLRAVVSEVNNTMGDRHFYLAHHPGLAPIGPDDTLSAAKLMHVSPFQPVAGEYRFRFGLSADKVTARIDFRHPGGGLTATLGGARVPLTSGAVLRAALRRPFGGLRTLTLIHLQAIRLWRAGARFRRRPTPPAQEVS